MFRQQGIMIVIHHRKRIRLFFISLLTLILCFQLSSPSLAQFPFSTGSGSSDTTIQTPWWSPNKARRCGRLWCSRVHLFGGFKNNFVIAAEPISASETVFQEDPVASALKVEERAKQVQDTYRLIYKRSLQFPANSTDAPLQANPWQDIFSHSTHQLHPNTPKIEVGFKNDQTVIYVPEQTEKGLSQQTIVTVNRADQLYHGKPIPELAQEWRNSIRLSLSEALWGYEFDRKYSFARFLIVAVIAVIMLIPLVVMGFIRKRLRRLNQGYRHQLRDLKQSLTHKVEADALSPEPSLTSEETFSENRNSSTEVAEFPSHNSLLTQIKQAFSNFGNVKQVLSRKVRAFGDNLPKISLKQHTLLKQRQNIIQLLLSLLLWLQILIFCLGLAVIVLVYPQSRPYALFFIGQGVLLPLIWMLVSIGDRVADFFVDYSLNQWAKEAQLLNPASRRYTLRVSTYSPALKSATTFLFTAIGIVLTLRLYVTDLQVFASAGLVAVVLAFLSRNVLEDMLNGVLILWTDRYAIGDVIQVGTVSGLVEDMNIYNTQIRGAEGRLVTIPNSKISIVENLTKDWSRVDFKIVIAYEADIQKALEIIRMVTQEMEADPQWQEKIIEPAAILGVDNLSSEGILIQVWLKTQPAQQWSVGREFRLRLKMALDQAGIRIGIPQQTVFYENRSAIS